MDDLMYRRVASLSSALCLVLQRSQIRYTQVIGAHIASAQHTTEPQPQNRTDDAEGCQHVWG